jgi:hypothetical protein
MPVNPIEGAQLHVEEDVSIATDVGRDVVFGDVLVDSATEEGLGKLASLKTDLFRGVVINPYGAAPSVEEIGPRGPDAIAHVVMWGKGITVRLENNLTINERDKLMMTTDGALTLAATGPVVGIARQTVTVGVVDQFITADIGPVGLGTVA